MQDNEIINIESIYDVIIVGSGVAGLYTALMLSSKANILVLSKQDRFLSNTSFAQGGIAGVIQNNGDNTQLHFQDTMIAGRFKNNPAAVRVLVDEAAENLDTLIHLGMPFDTRKSGYDRAIEGGHSKRRVYHSKDQTGKKLIDTLLQQVQSRLNITFLEYATLYDLEKVDSGFVSHVLYKENNLSIFSPFVVLATGGIGRVYQYTTNAKIATGDGIRIAQELGAKIANMHYIQFHPTALCTKKTEEQFLISEAVRGEGAYLLNHKHERFLENYDQRGEMAPRDVVSQAILQEEERTKSHHFYLDITHKPKDFILERFPSIAKKCLEEGIDISRDPIPIYPCQHYLMGGIDVDLNAQSSIQGLYAVGECAHTGVHGENRLASNSLLEALVWGKRAALNIQQQLQKNSVASAPLAKDTTDEKSIPVPEHLRKDIQHLVQEAFFVIPHLDKAKEALKKLEVIYTDLKTMPYLPSSDYYETLSIASVAKLILTKVVKQ